MIITFLRIFNVPEQVVSARHERHERHKGRFLVVSRKKAKIETEGMP
jgi:hypothetical protein